MAAIVSVSSFTPPYSLTQETTTEFARELFQSDFHDIERLLKVFANGEIEERQFATPLHWFKKDHSLKERNDLYIERATVYSVEAIRRCLNESQFLKDEIKASEIDAMVFVSSTGIATPSIDARIMNKLPFSPHMKRIPLWGLGCAGGAAGVSRAFEYCRSYPEENVLVVCVELCSLTFQHNDRSKSNLIGASLFGDGVACVLISGNKSSLIRKVKNRVYPVVTATESTLMPNSEEVMGWDMKDSGLHVIFSRDIPSIIRKWLQGNVNRFLSNQSLSIEEIVSFIAHPGGKKVLDAYRESLNIDEEMLELPKMILRKHGNMSSPTVLYVLEQVMKQKRHAGDLGLMVALGPGFCSEFVLLEWKEASA